ncbi:contractile injection system protein, VgrG/Pvc8 family [Nonomuraea sp. NPDC052116]|uniref:phage late control D family protein n=1 Tax=Nonomuraea sp. NPDC052116 TaxID=3155665 RepID=UPI00344A4D20
MAQTPPLYTARPEVRLDGRRDASLTDGLLAATAEESSDGLFRCEATFGNWGSDDGRTGFRYADRRVLDFGRGLTLRMGAGDKAGEVFTGRITALEACYPADRPPEITVLAEDRFQDLRMTRRTRTFEFVTASDVVGSVAADHGLRADADLDGPTYGLLAQVNQSDLAFLRDVARAVDAEVWTAGDTLHAAPRPRRAGAAVKLAYGSELYELTILADLAGQRTAVSVSGWDVSAKEAVDEAADDSAIGSELDGGTSGISILRQAFGERRDRLAHTVPFTPAEGRAVAQAELRRAARRFVTGRAVSEGDARIRAGSSVELSGVGGIYEGRYQVVLVRHEFTPEQGYRTTFWVERPVLREAR